MNIDRLVVKDDYTIIGRLRVGDCFELADAPHEYVYVSAACEGGASIYFNNGDDTKELPYKELAMAFCLNTNTVKVFSKNTKVLPVFLRVTECCPND